MVIIYKLAILHSYTKLPEDRYITLNRTQINGWLDPQPALEADEGLVPAGGIGKDLHLKEILP